MSPPPEDEVEYLDLVDQLALTRFLRAGPVRDLGLLDSDCARPRSRVLGRGVEMDDDAAFALVVEVAAGTLDVPQIVERLAAS